MKTTPSKKALEHVYHAVFLQLFFSVFPALILPFLSAKGVPAILCDARTCTVAFAMLSVNTLIYLGRYERSLAAPTSET
jgi:hypothetical protein